MIITNNKHDIHVRESLDIMASLSSSIDTTRNTIEDNIQATNNGLIVEELDFERIIREVKDLYLKICEQAVTVTKHCKMGDYADSLKEIQDNILKNIVVEDISIDKLIKVNSLIPDFTISVLNLGIDGILISDRVNLRLFYSSNESVIDIEINSPIEQIGERYTIAVSGLMSLSIPCVAELEISFNDLDGNTYSSHILGGINIYDEGGASNDSQ
ncbi:MAG: hypothetical protein ACRCX2_11090 [Paraclostridium sp.]